MLGNLFAEPLSTSFFGLPLNLEPSTSYSIHFFTQSVSSIRFRQKKQKSKEVVSVVGIILLYSPVSARFQHATDAVYDQYRCPVFKGFVVCVSGLASEDRNSVRSLVELNGQCWSSHRLLSICFRRYGDSAGNTIEENSSAFSIIRMC